MKKNLLILCALLLTAVGASAQGYVTTITNTQATWIGATGFYSETAAERYLEGEYGTGKILYQAIGGLQAGTYQVTVYATANFTANRGFTAASGSGIAQVFANSTTQDITVGTDTGVTLGTGNSYTLSCTVGVDGILEYGIQNIAAGGNWYVCQGVSCTLTQESTPTVAVGELHTCVAEIGHWTTTGNNGTFVLNDWSVETDESGMKVPFCQNWVWEGEPADVTLTTAKISHAPFSGLPAGFYEVSLDIRILNELGAAIGTGTTFNANSVSEDLDQTDADGHEGTYNGATEVYGTYTLIAEVTTDGTLDISIQLPASPTYNWIAWKNLKVEYLGTTIEYEIHEPECSAKVVQPGDEVSIVYECITPNTSKEPTLDATKSITVGGITVTDATLECAGYSATVTFTIPNTITTGQDVTISVPEGLIYWNLKEEDSSAENVLSPEATFTVHTPATITDGDYLIMNSDGNYLAGGLTWGTQAMEGGRPQFFTFAVQDDGAYTLDSHQSNGGNNHYLGAGLYCDAESAHWTLVAIDGGYALYYAGANSYVTGNGFQVALTLSDEPTVWKLVTKDEIIAKMDDATEANPVDVSALIPSCEPKRNAWGASWTMTAYDGSSTINNGSLGQNANVASCAESYYSNNGFDIRQSVTFPKKGVYELSAQAFYSGTAGAVMYVSSSDATGYNTDGNSVALPEQGSTSASNMVTAYQEFLEGLHPVSLQFTVDSDETTLYVGFSSAASSNSAWNIFGELGLQYLGAVDYDYDVTWKLANPSFEVDNVVADLSEDTSADDGGTARHDDEDEGAWIVESLTGWDLSSSEVDVVDLMTAEANATDNNLGVPSAAADGTYWLYLKKTWGDNAGSASVKQKVTLPAGEYKLTVQSMAIAGSATAKLVAGEASKSITINGTSAGSENSHPIAELTDWTTNELAFTVENDDTEVELGVDFTFPIGASVGSFLIDNFKLLSTAEISETISWTMTEAGWGTMILPFAVTTVPNGLTLYAGSALSLGETDEDGNTALTPGTAATSIAANTPYLVSGSANTYEFIGVPTNEKEIYSDGMLTGTLVDLAVAKGAAFTLDGTEYLLQHHDSEDESAAFYPIIVTDGENDSSEATLDKYHCYLNTANDGQNPVRAFISLPGTDGETTAIVAVESEEAEGNGAIYDLSGRKVSKAVKGVYIQNGKKVLVK